MSEHLAVLLTDVVDSTKLNEEFGDTAMGGMWQRHDRAARDLIRTWRGREIGRSDGFLVVFGVCADAVHFSMEYQRFLAATPMKARVGIHFGELSVRQNSVADTSLGSTVFEMDGVALPIAARVMAIAHGGQTLLTASALQALNDADVTTKSHGHWMMKGLVDPLEVFEVGDADAAFQPPEDCAKGYRVARVRDVWKPVREVPSNIPAERDPFFGRTDALRSLSDLLNADSRLVTLLGTGGIGKTRLALRYAHLWLGDYPGGGWFCDLSAARGTDGIAYAVAQGLQMPLGKFDPVQQLGAAIASRGKCLIVLDNFEQITRCAEETLGAWLERAPEACFVVSSREVLGVVGEHVLMLAPLAAAEAVSLFKQRVHAAGRLEPFTVQDDAVIRSLIDLLDRLPLAIELAAARSRAMSLPTLLKRMGERFKLLASRGGRIDRQATLRATLDWSWNLLSRHEQSTLAQLSTFEGGFTSEAASVIVNLSSRDNEPVEDVLQALVDKSLLRFAENGRFVLLRTVHDYGTWQLNQARLTEFPSDEHSGAERRHWTYYASFERAEAARCLVELENLVLACRRAALAEDAGHSVECLLAAWRAIRMVGPFRAGVDLIEPLRRLSERGLLTAVERVRLLWVTGRVYLLLGEHVGARRAFDEGLAVSGEAQMAGWHGRLLCASGEQLAEVGRVGESKRHLLEALELAINSGDAELTREARNALGNLAVRTGEFNEAREQYELALPLCTAARDSDFRGGLLGNLGEVCMALGQADEALDHLSTSLTLLKSVGHRRWEGNMRCNLGLLHHEQGRSSEAEEEFERALKIARDIGHVRLEATVLCNLGIALASAGRLDAAFARHQDAVEIALASGDRRAEGQFRCYLGQTMIDLDRLDQAKECLRAGETLLRDAQDAVSLALLLCEQARLFALRGDYGLSRAALAEASETAMRLSVSADSELGRAIARVHVTHDAHSR